MRNCVKGSQQHWKGTTALGYADISFPLLFVYVSVWYTDALTHASTLICVPIYISSQGTVLSVLLYPSPSYSFVAGSLWNLELTLLLSWAPVISCLSTPPPLQGISGYTWVLGPHGYTQAQESLELEAIPRIQLPEV